MSESHLFPEFRDQFQNTKYPFVDGATLVSQNGQAIDETIFLDASLYPIGFENYLFIQKIVSNSITVDIVLADSTLQPAASCTFNPFNTSDCLNFVDQYNRPAGLIVSTQANLQLFAAWAAGTYTFKPADTMFVASCTVPTPGTGVNGFILETGEVFTGPVTIVGDTGVVVRKDAPGVLRVDVVGDPLFQRTLCGKIGSFATPNFIQTINGVPPDEYGNFYITVGNSLNENTILRIYPYNNTLVVEAVGNA